MFVEELKKEIDMYMVGLSYYNGRLLDEDAEVLKKAISKAKDVFNKNYTTVVDENKYFNHALICLDEFYPTVEKIKRLANSKENEQEIQAEYKKLLEIKRVVRSCFSASGNRYDDVSKTKNRINSFIDDNKKVFKGNWRELFQYLDGIDKKDETEYLNNLSDIVMDEVALNADKYPNLIQVIKLLTFHKGIINIFPNLPEQFSIVCKEKYEELCNTYRGDKYEVGKKPVNKAVFKSITLPCKIEMDNRNKPSFFAFPYDVKMTSTSYPILRDAFLADILQIIETNPNIDFPGIVSALRNRYVESTSVEISEDFTKDFAEFTRLYRETPEQILITEQRYFRTKEIEMQREQAELDRKERIRQAREERRMYKEEQEENRRHERELQREAENNVEKERTKMWWGLCQRCSLFRNGCQGGVLGCGNFRSK